MDAVLVLDFGTRLMKELIDRLTAQSVRTDLLPGTVYADAIDRDRYKGIVLSGSPCHVYEADAPLPDPRVYELGLPILGICYGSQLMARQLGGLVQPGKREKGPCTVTLDPGHPLFAGIPRQTTVYMSHRDYIRRLPDGFALLGYSDTCPVCAMADETRRLYAVQFHPENALSETGDPVLHNFLFRICGCREV